MIRRTPLKRSTKPIPRKRAKPRRVAVNRDPGYLQFLREEGRCVACAHDMNIPVGRECRSCDPAHGPVNGMRSKGPDSEALPLGRVHHEEQHILRWHAFENKYGFDRAEEAATWYAAYLIWKEHTAK